MKSSSSAFIFFLFHCISTITTIDGLNIAPPPLMGIGAILFRPRGTVVKRASLGDDAGLIKAGKFFTEAFWAEKVGGGVKILSTTQNTSLERQQIQEFRRRYGGKMSARDETSELLISENPKGEIMGCIGIEVDSVNRGPNQSKQVIAPLMSNLAVGKAFRRRGLAEELVAKAENLARRQWGYDECYLLVEQRNKAAMRLYQKLGYRRVWVDKDARTLIPMESGGIKNASTVIVCMRKRISGGIFNFLPF